jgi:predicted GNAT family acetyltransferase
MGMMEETLEAWLVGQGIDKALVQQAIGVARAEMETGQLQAMYNSYVQGDTTATAGGAQMEALSTMVSQLGRAAASATELQASSLTLLKATVNLALIPSRPGGRIVCAVHGKLEKQLHTSCTGVQCASVRLTHTLRSYRLWQ